ncbi:hypothetical protein [Streptomyces mirabilis]|uniref:hypothetical protein n=1 Tax=Streptomyces mirabilis TaxID=68239 RepID=UPI0036DC9857
MTTVEAVLPHLASGERTGRRVPFISVRRRGDAYAPLRWRAYCSGCGSWRIAKDGTAGSWEQLMNEVTFHLVTGMWS